MTFAIAVVLIVTIVALVLFFTNWLPMDFTALLVMVTLMLTGVITPEEGLAGFSHPATITVMALLMLSIGLQSTGFVYFLSNNMIKLTGRSEFRLLLFIILIVGISSAFMNNTAIVAIFLPVVVRCAKYANVNVSKVLMPLSFAAMIGGTITIIGTSTNIIVSSLSESNGYGAFGLFDFSLLGIILLLSFIAYWFTIGRIITPTRRVNDDLTKSYNVEKYLAEVVVKANSPGIGKPLSNNLFGVDSKVEVIEWIRDGKTFIVNPQNYMRAGDRFIIKAELNDLKEILNSQGWEIRKDHTEIDDKDLISKETVLVEAVIGRNSFLIGKKIKNIDFNGNFGAVPIAVRRSGVSLLEEIGELDVEFGDTFLMEAQKSKLENFYNSPDFIVLQRIKKMSLFEDKMWLSVAIVVVTIIVTSLQLMPLIIPVLTGAVALVLTRCVTMPYIYRKIEWKVIFLLAGLIPLGIAFQKSGASELLTQGLMHLVGNWQPRSIVSILFLLTLFLTSFMSNNATALILTPIAIALANGLNIDPKPFLVAVMFAASTSFITPVGYQTNMLIFGPGNYKSKDFFIVGGALAFLFWILCTILIPWLYL